MKRKVDWEEEEQGERKDYFVEESDEEEPRIKDVLDNFSQAVAQYSNFQRYIFFWTPRGQLLRHQHLIPVTNISELVEYVLLPHNSDVAKLRAPNIFPR